MASFNHHQSSSSSPWAIGPNGFQQYEQTPEQRAIFTQGQSTPLFYQPDGSIAPTMPTFGFAQPPPPPQPQPHHHHQPPPPSSSNFSFEMRTPFSTTTPGPEARIEALEAQIEEMRLAKVAAEEAAKAATDQRAELWERMRKVEADAERLVAGGTLTEDVRKEIFARMRVQGKKRLKKLGPGSTNSPSTTTTTAEISEGTTRETFIYGYIASDDVVSYTNASTSTSDDSRYVDAGSDPVVSYTDSSTSTTDDHPYTDTGSDPVVSYTDAATSTADSQTSTSVGTMTEPALSRVEVRGGVISSMWQAAKKKRTFFTRLFVLCLVLAALGCIINQIVKSCRPPPVVPVEDPEPEIVPACDEVIRQIERVLFPVSKEDVSVLPELRFCGDRDPLCWLKCLRVLPGRSGGFRFARRLGFSCQYLKDA
ncbi:hypothetical protein HYFRA_00002676 [Hymenoscyphus fraxineus]|uniref:Uncharacterized protein n=1 Tax=Hymenoscyphus fraxineus TaxID=746836 RepID=A0A9N9PZK2_9HELO|nr:hypothetical protein HYFRA_00002676 [Hymenoscyphus fraxineus]